MDYFQYKQGTLHCEQVSVAGIAERVGTPAYIYSAASLLDAYHRLAEAFRPLDPLICFSVKSLSNVHILKLLAQAGAGFDVVSGGELARVRQGGGDPGRTAFAGVGKTEREIDEAIAAGVMLFNVESAQEFEALSARARAAESQVRAALRVNPDVYDPRTHKYTTTGRKRTKFGVDLDRAEDFFEAHGRDGCVRLDAVHIHLGSPVLSPDPYVEAIRRVLALIGQLRAKGHTIETFDLGGGFAAEDAEGMPVDATRYAEAIVPLLRDQELRIILEPGRHIAAEAGILLTRTLYTKDSGEKNFVIVDAAMTDLIRPSLYGAEHFVWPVVLARSEAPPQRRLDYEAADARRVDIVGGVCESADFLAKDRMLPPVKRGDYLAVFSAGAYGFVMSSQYNARPRAAEVLVETDAWRTIRRRETYEDLMAAEMDL